MMQNKHRFRPDPKAKFRDLFSVGRLYLRQIIGVAGSDAGRVQFYDKSFQAVRLAISG